MELGVNLLPRNPTGNRNGYFDCARPPPVESHAIGSLDLPRLTPFHLLFAFRRLLFILSEPTNYSALCVCLLVRRAVLFSGSGSGQTTCTSINSWVCIEYCKIVVLSS